MKKYPWWDTFKKTDEYKNLLKMSEDELDKIDEIVFDNKFYSFHEFEYFFHNILTEDEKELPITFLFIEGLVTL